MVVPCWKTKEQNQYRWVWGGVSSDDIEETVNIFWDDVSLHCGPDLKDNNPVISAGQLVPTTLHLHTKFGYKMFSSSEDIFWTIWTHRLMDRVIPVKSPPPNFVTSGYKNTQKNKTKKLPLNESHR